VTDDEVRASVLAALDEFNDAWRSRDLEALLAQFAAEADVLLLGSEQGEVARGPVELRRLLEHFFAEPITYEWRWQSREVFGSGTLAWLAAESAIVETGPDGEATLPYRITGVLERRGARWLWRLFHGSAPDPPHADWDAIVRDGGTA
jgi:uncharacterized protein (TIGR02246 family)